MYFSREHLFSETLHWPKTADVIWTQPDDIIRVVVMRIDDKYWCCNQDLADKSWAKSNPESDCPFSEARQPLYMEGIMNDWATFLRSVSDCSSMSQRNIPESSISEWHDESDDKSERKWVIKPNTVTHHGKIRIKMERWLFIYLI